MLYVKSDKWVLCERENIHFLISLYRDRLQLPLELFRRYGDSSFSFFLFFSFLNRRSCIQRFEYVSACEEVKIILKKCWHVLFEPKTPVLFHILRFMCRILTVHASWTHEYIKTEATTKIKAKQDNAKIIARNTWSWTI